MTEMISANPKVPTIAGINEMPPARSVFPNEKRVYAWIPSMPIMATKSPRKPEIHPLRGSFGAVRLPHMTIPKMENHTNSYD